MKIIVTGGAGFIGSNLIRHLVNNSKDEILNLDKLTYASNLNSLSDIKHSKRYFFKKVDICNKDLLKRVVFNFKPNAIVHLAAESHVDRSIDDPSDFINTNILGTYNLLEISREYFDSLPSKQKNKFKFHHVSTDEVYGDLGFSKNLFHEGFCYKPSSPYSASKAGSDHLVMSWNRTFGLPVLLTNCSNNYGPYQFPEKLIPNTILRAISLKKIPIYGNGKQVRDWLYVEDHAKAIECVLRKAKSGETYVIGGKNEVSNIKVVKEICKILDNVMPIKSKQYKNYDNLIEYVEDRPGHDLRYAINPKKINEDLSWEPVETFNSGLYKTVMWYLNNKMWLDEIFKKNFKMKRIGLRK